MMWGVLDSTGQAVTKVIRRAQDVRVADGRLVSAQLLVAASEAELATFGIVPIDDQVPSFDPATHQLDGDPQVVKQGGRWVETATVSPRPAVDLAQRLRDQVRGLREQKEREYFQYNGAVFQVDPDSQRKIDSEVKSALDWDAYYTAAGITPIPAWSIGPGWRTYDNNFVAMTKAEFLQFGIAVREHVRALHAAKWTHFAQIAALEAAGDVTALLSYDITSGWPQTGVEWLAANPV